MDQTAAQTPQEPFFEQTDAAIAYSIVMGSREAAMEFILTRYGKYYKCSCQQLVCKYFSRSPDGAPRLYNNNCTRRIAIPSLRAYQLRKMLGNGSILTLVSMQGSEVTTERLTPGHLKNFYYYYGFRFMGEHDCSAKRSCDELCYCYCKPLRFLPEHVAFIEQYIYYRAYLQHNYACYEEFVAYFPNAEVSKLQYCARLKDRCKALQIYGLDLSKLAADKRIVLEQRNEYFGCINCSKRCLFNSVHCNVACMDVAWTRINGYWYAIFVLTGITVFGPFNVGAYFFKTEEKDAGKTEYNLTVCLDFFVKNDLQLKGIAYFLTDDSEVMKTAAESFATAKHKLCAWHVCRSFIVNCQKNSPRRFSIFFNCMTRASTENEQEFYYNALVYILAAYDLSEDCYQALITRLTLVKNYCGFLDIETNGDANLPILISSISEGVNANIIKRGTSKRSSQASIVYKVMGLDSQSVEAQIALYRELNVEYPPDSMLYFIEPVSKLIENYRKLSHKLTVKLDHGYYSVQIKNTEIVSFAEYRVDTGDYTCPCKYFALTGLPCKHYYALWSYLYRDISVLSRIPVQYARYSYKLLVRRLVTYQTEYAMPSDTDLPRNVDSTPITAETTESQLFLCCKSKMEYLHTYSLLYELNNVLDALLARQNVYGSPSPIGARTRYSRNE